MLAPLQGFLDREVIGVYKVAAVTASGVVMDYDGSVTTALSVSPYAHSFANLAAATITTAGGLKREVGYLLQPVSATGPSLLSVLSQIYDESVAAGGTAAILPAKAGAHIATDQIVANPTAGYIDFTGSHPAIGAVCSVAAGLIRVLQSGDEPRFRFEGQVVVKGLALASFMII